MNLVFTEKKNTNEYLYFNTLGNFYNQSANDKKEGAKKFN